MEGNNTRKINKYENHLIREMKLNRTRKMDELRKQIKHKNKDTRMKVSKDKECRYGGEVEPKSQH